MQIKKLIVFILILIILLAIYISFFYPGNLNKYQNIENNYEIAAKEIYDSKLIKSNNNMNKIIITKKEMMEIKDNNNLFNDNCDGYVIITNNKPDLSYKAYIKCQFKYKTTGFEKSFLN